MQLASIMACVLSLRDPIHQTTGLDARVTGPPNRRCYVMGCQDWHPWWAAGVPSPWQADIGRPSRCVCVCVPAKTSQNQPVKANPGPYQRRPSGGGPRTGLRRPVSCGVRLGFHTRRSTLRPVVPGPLSAPQLGESRARPRGRWRLAVGRGSVAARLAGLGFLTSTLGGCILGLAVCAIANCPCSQTPTWPAHRGPRTWPWLQCPSDLPLPSPLPVSCSTALATHKV